MLVIDRSEYCNLDQQDEHTATERHEDLAHDDVANVLVWLAEVDHQANTEHEEEVADKECPLETTSTTDGVSDGEQCETGDNLERAVDVSGGGDRQVAHHLKERCEVAVPAVVRDLIGGIDQARGDDSAVREEAVVQEWCLREIQLIDHESDQGDKADDDHGDDVVSTPSVWRVGSQREWQQEDSQACCEQEDTRDYAMISSAQM